MVRRVVYWCQTVAQLDVGCTLVHCLIALDPSHHLLDLVLEIRCVIRFFGEVNVKLLGLFRVVIVSCTEKGDRSSIMDQTMEFGKVGVFPDSKIDENLFLHVKLVQCGIQSVKAFCGMHRILRKIYEIK